MRTKEEEFELERKDSLFLFQNPPAWPQWPYQTIKRRKADGTLPDVAVLVDFGTPGEAFKIHLIEKNLFTLSQEDVEHAMTTDQINAEALIADGWVVD